MTVNERFKMLGEDSTDKEIENFYGNHFDNNIVKVYNIRYDDKGFHGYEYNAVNSSYCNADEICKPFMRDGKVVDFTKREDGTLQSITILSGTTNYLFRLDAMGNIPVILRFIWSDHVTNLRILAEDITWFLEVAPDYHKSPLISLFEY